MEHVLARKLHGYIINNHPELLLSLPPQQSADSYIEEKVNAISPMVAELLTARKPMYIIEDLCFRELIKDLQPSRYNYIKGILEEEFEEAFQNFKKSGVLTYEIVNMIGACEPVFSELNFSEENIENRRIRYAVIGVISDYLKR